MGRPVHFEIHASDPERAVRFYETVFGWQVDRWGDEEYWMLGTGDGPGINGGLMRRQGSAEPTPDQAVSGWVVTVDVEDCDAAVEAARRAGGTVAVERRPIPGVGWLAYLRDTEGNLLGVMQSDENAA